jgi:hypothetical protein
VGPRWTAGRGDGIAPAEGVKLSGGGRRLRQRCPVSTCAVLVSATLLRPLPLSAQCLHARHAAGTVAPHEGGCGQPECASPSAFWTAASAERLTYSSTSPSTGCACELRAQKPQQQTKSTASRAVVANPLLWPLRAPWRSPCIVQSSFPLTCAHHSWHKHPRELPGSPRVQSDQVAGVFSCTAVACIDVCTSLATTKPNSDHKVMHADC